MKKYLSFIISIILSISVMTSTCIAAFADDMRYGIDVSHNNGVVNFEDLKNDGKGFAMIRLGYFNYLDKCFWDNVKAACDADMDFGVYLYSYAESVEEARLEARFVVETLSQLGDYAKKFTLPVAYDMEDKKLAPYGKQQLTMQMTEFLDIITAAGYTPMVYANTNWFENYLDLSKAANYKLWYAAYGKGTPDNVGRIQIGSSGIYADMWQYSDGKDKGLDENVIYNPSEIIKPLPCCHSYEMSQTAPSCNAEGEYRYSCTKCQKAFSVAIDRIAHSVVSDNAIAATYFSAGKTSGSHCAVCGEVISAQSSVAKKKPSVSKLSAKKKAVAVKWGKVSSAKGYELQLSTSKSFTKKTTTTKTIKNAKTVSMTVSKLSAKKKYYVRIRAYKTVNGKKTYSPWSAVKSIKTK